MYTRNRGVAFGFLPGDHVAVTILIGLALAVLLVHFALHSTRALIWLPTGMIAGGALGNIIDRLRHGSVTDFIKLPLGWPPFNLADASITLGILLLFLLIDRARKPTSCSDERDAPFTIAFEDEHLIVVDKAPGVVVHPARGHRENTLSQLLAPLLDDDDSADPERRGIVHRLDRDTSGLLVVARSDAVLRRLQAALARRQIQREYLALVEGRPPARTGTVEAPIGRDPRVRTRMAVGGAGAARGAHALHARARAPGQLAAAPTTRDRAHAPDPRAHAGDRPPGVRRPRVRHRGRFGLAAPVPARDEARVRAPRHGRARGRQLAAARGPATCAVARRRAILISQI